jgi:PAS domain S-box-containing protein
MTVPVERAAGDRMDRMRLPPWLRRGGDYGLALLFVAAATLLRWVLSDVLKPVPTLVFYLAWVGAAAFGGLGPGLLATVASWLCIELLFEFTPGKINFADPMSMGRLVVMMAGGLVVGVVGEKMRRSRLRERQQGQALGVANAQLQARTGELLAANEELREREQALTESRKKYRGLVEKINDWVWEVDADGVYTYASPRALELLGYAPEEIVGKSPFDLMPPDEAARVWNAFQSIWSERKPLELFENTLRRKDGRRVIVETSGMPVFAEDGSFQGYTGIDRDVTSRKQAEEALRESEEKFRLLAETSPAAILIYQDDRYVYVNPAAESLTGYRRAELLPQAPGEVVHPDFRRRVKEMAARRAQGEGTPTHYELKILTKDGRERWMDSETVSIMYGNRPAGLVMAFDVTERKQAEEALRRSEEQFHHLFEDDLTGNVISTPDGEIVLCNPAFAQIFGFSCAAEAVGTNIVDLYLDPRERRLLLERLQQEGKVERLEVWHRRRDGEPIYIVENIVGRFDEQGRLCEVKGYLFEDTQRKRAEEALHELTATLESRVAERTAELEERARQLQKLTLELSEAEERERERVAQILHDDLQQVLAAAKFHLSRVGGGTGSPDQSREIIGQVKEMLKNAIEQSRHLSHELSPVVLRQGDLAEALDWLAEQMQTKHGVTVRVEAVGTVATESDAVKTLLYRSAQEMLFNVVKHARVKEARLRVRRRGRYLCLSVSDRGRGFDPQEIGKTTGFGLLSIRERVALLGGRMKIRSAKGRGTTFRIIVSDVESFPRT